MDALIEWTLDAVTLLGSLLVLLVLAGVILFGVGTLVLAVFYSVRNGIREWKDSRRVD